jgi:hypothetical protein
MGATVKLEQVNCGRIQSALFREWPAPYAYGKPELAPGDIIGLSLLRTVKGGRLGIIVAVRYDGILVLWSAL